MIEPHSVLNTHRPRPPLLAIALLSASALAYEVLLMRLFSIVQWHHFAYMVISLALLGYGVSGTFLSLTQKWLLPRFSAAEMPLAVGTGQPQPASVR